MISHTNGTPGRNTAADVAGRAIYARGPVTQERLFSIARFGETSGSQSYNFGKAVSIGWLVELPDGMVGISDKARHYYARTEPEPKEMGYLATPRAPTPFKPLSRKNRPDSRGTRTDAPDVRAWPSHYATAATTQAVKSGSDA